MHLDVSFFANNSKPDVVNILMLRVTARTLFLRYLVVDVIINPVNLRSGKLTRCSEIQCPCPCPQA